MDEVEFGFRPYYIVPKNWFNDWLTIRRIDSVLFFEVGMFQTT